MIFEFSACYSGIFKYWSTPTERLWIQVIGLALTIVLSKSALQQVVTKISASKENLNMSVSDVESDSFYGGLGTNSAVFVGF